MRAQKTYEMERAFWIKDERMLFRSSKGEQDVRDCARQNFSKSR